LPESIRSIASPGFERVKKSNSSRQGAKAQRKARRNSFVFFAPSRPLRLCVKGLSCSGDFFTRRQSFDISSLLGLESSLYYEVSTVAVVTNSHVKVADEVWIAAALLHREHPAQPDFTAEEIVERAMREGIGGPIRPGVYVHVVQHCVANRPPNPGRYRMLFETMNGRRRLFRKGDVYHPAREGAKITPNMEDVPTGYRGLLAWYRDWCSAAINSAPETDPLLSLASSGKHLWADEHADDYVQRLREGWE
jgi:hypothetical protein